MLPIKEKLLTGYNRPFRKLKKLKGIVVHWTANTNKGANALAHYSYFNRKKTDNVYGSAHYVVDDSNIYRYVPDDEFAYHVGAKSYKPVVYSKLGVPQGDTPNYYTVGIEMCVNSDGDFIKTRENTIDLLRYLLDKYKLKREHVYRHFDITGKDCPKMMLDNNVWNDFLDDVFADDADNAPAFKVNVSELNVRKGPGTSYDVVKKLRKGDRVTKSGISGVWYQIGQNEWVHGGYLIPV